MKKMFSNILLTTTVCLTGFIMPVSAEKDIDVYVNNCQVEFDQAPVIENDRTLVPLRAICEALGAEVGWDSGSRKISLNCKGSNIVMQIGNKNMNFNGNNVVLDAIPKIFGDRTLVPLRVISECFGADVEWNEALRKIFITCGNNSSGNASDGNNNNSGETVPDTIPKPEVTPDTTPEPEVTPDTTPEPEVTPDTTPKPEVTPDTTPKPNEQSIEIRVLELVNIERQKNGLNPLTWNNSLADVARAHSKDMHDRKFFSHTNPDGLSPFDRMKNYGISYSRAAENIAAGQSTPEAVMQSWMNSSGHRANILNPDLKEMGVGFYKGSNGYKTYWTQCFISNR